MQCRIRDLGSVNLKPLEIIGTGKTGHTPIGNGAIGQDQPELGQRGELRNERQELTVIDRGVLECDRPLIAIRRSGGCPTAGRGRRTSEYGRLPNAFRVGAYG